MATFKSATFGVLLSCAFAAGLAAACHEQGPRSPGDEDDGSNLCVDYDTCNQCISGLKRNGDSEGEAETLCGAAVLGCWTTWDKPIVCGRKHYDEKPN